MIFASFDTLGPESKNTSQLGHQLISHEFAEGLKMAKIGFWALIRHFLQKSKISIWALQMLPRQVLTANSENSTNFTPICLFLAQTLKFSFLRSVSTNGFYCCLTSKIRSESRKIKIPVNCVLGLFKVLNRYFELNEGVWSRFEQNKIFRFFGEN